MAVNCWTRLTNNQCTDRDVTMMSHLSVSPAARGRS